MVDNSLVNELVKLDLKMICNDFQKQNNLLKSNKQDVNFSIEELNAKIIYTAAP